MHENFEMLNLFINKTIDFASSIVFNKEHLEMFSLFMSFFFHIFFFMRRSRWTRRTWPTSWSGSAAAFPSSASSSSLSPLVIGSYQWHFYGQEHLSISVLFISNSFPLHSLSYLFSFVCHICNMSHMWPFRVWSWLIDFSYVWY